MSTITIPNRPAGTDVRSIEQILANFDAITNGVNGNLDTTNLSATAAIKRSQMAGGFGNLKLTNQGNYTASDGDWVNSTGGGTTINLPPTPAVNATVAVTSASNATGANPTTVNGNGNNIYGKGSNTAWSSIGFGTPNETIMFMFLGGSWQMVVGELDTGWVNITLINGWAALAGSFIPQYRRRGNGVQFRGGLSSATATSTTVSSLDSNSRPSSTVVFPVAQVYNTPISTLYATISGSGLVLSSATGVDLAPIQFDLS